MLGAERGGDGQVPKQAALPAAPGLAWACAALAGVEHGQVAGTAELLSRRPADFRVDATSAGTFAGALEVPALLDMISDETPTRA